MIGRLSTLGVLLGTLAALTTVVAHVRESAIIDASKAPAFRSGQLTMSETKTDVDYQRIHQKLTYGRGTLADARLAMTDPNPASLANQLHALYVMRHHREVLRLLEGIWELDEEKYPELNWSALAKAPARIALASTLNRIKIIRTEPYLDYIRSQKDHEHEFIRAQVVVALGFNGNATDLPYLKAMSDGDNHYVAQSAITGLTLFGGNRARDILIELAAKHRGSPRGDLMDEMLRVVYKWSPGERPSRAAATVN